MMFKNIILGVILLLFSAPLTAQSKYALSVYDYMSDKFTTVEGLTMTSRSRSNGVWNGEADFVPSTGDNTIDELLRKKAKFIIHKDTLYVNCIAFKCKGIRIGRGYAPGFRYDNKQVAFIAKTVDEKSSVAAAGMMFGMLGGVIASVVAEASEKERTCYLVSSDEKNISGFDQHRTMNVLVDYPELFQAYKDEPKERQESTAVIIEYLNKAGLLSRY